jgi:hypothetical protein
LGCFGKCWEVLESRGVGHMGYTHQPGRSATTVRVGTVGLTGTLCRTTTFRHRKHGRTNGPGRAPGRLVGGRVAEICAPEGVNSGLQLRHACSPQSGRTCSRIPSTSASHHDKLRIQRPRDAYGRRSPRHDGCARLYSARLGSQARARNAGSRPPPHSVEQQASAVGKKRCRPLDRISPNLIGGCRTHGIGLPCRCWPPDNQADNQFRRLDRRPFP